MKRIDIYLQNAVVALAFTLIALPATADIQINQAEGFVHAAYNPVNQDQELYLQIPNSDNSQDTTTQSASYTGIVSIKCADRTPLLEGVSLGGEIVLTPDNAADGRQCTLTDVNGDARQTNRWEVQVRKEYTPPLLYGLDICSYRVHVYCSDY